ncbi:L-2-amino-thiazoline-4-carboxylic acid hydrolase [Arthrobacter sp. CDRTa11]|uniref:L-2-amino-thiazoline-4-carboxylic acid hydrolase n=1 Tax=Arthrobacter sp. CDRTa11 TaxID=2651199 RepID=UPI002265CB77|nr:L-2-amino-thiazoline-4-carboxylic acid hydrolase [Arthrobacter sp. CDRTa11]
MAAVKEQAQIIFDRHSHKAPDPQGMMVVGLPSLVIAAHRELTARGVSEGVAFEVLRRTYRSMLGAEMRLLTQIEVFFMRDPLKFYEKNFIPLLNSMFGKSFTWDKKTTQTGWVLVGTQCGFWDMFRAEGAPQLTKLICEWDRNYLNVLDKSRRPIATRRTMTLSTGSSHCEFHFDRAAAGASKTVDVVIESSR